MPSAGKKVIALMVGICAICWTTPAKCAAQTDLIEAVMDRSMACLVIRSFSETAQTIERYCRDASPSLFEWTEMADVLIDEMFGLKIPGGIDKKGTFVWSAVPNPKDEEFVAFYILPVSDLQAIRSLEVCKATEIAGLYHIVKSDSGEKPHSVLMVLSEQYIAFAMPAHQAILVEWAAEITQTASNLSHWHTVQRQLVKEPIFFSLHLELLEKQYGSKLNEQVEKMHQTLQEKSAVMPMALFYSQLGMQLWHQTQRLSIGITPQVDQLTAQLVFTARKDSPLDKVLSASQPTPIATDLAMYADDSNIANVLMTIPKPLGEAITTWMLEMLAKMPASPFKPADMDTLRDSFQKIIRASGQNVFFSFRHRLDNEFPYQVTQVMDDAQTDYLQTVLPVDCQAVNLIYEKLNIPLKVTWQQTPTSLDGLEVYQFTYAEIANASPTDRKSEEQDAAQQKEKENEPTEKIEVQDSDLATAPAADRSEILPSLSQWAVQKDKRLFILTGGSLDDLKTVVSMPERKANGSLKKTLALIPSQNAHIVASINLVNLMAGWATSIAAFTQDQDKDKIRPIAFPSESCLAVSGLVADGALTATVILPKAHLKEINRASDELQKLWLATTLADKDQAAADDAAPQNQESDDGHAADIFEDWLGKPMPNLVLTDLQGNTIQLSDLKGKKVILDIWATWCPPCKKMIAEWNTLRQNLSTDNVVIIGISNEPIERLKVFAQKTPMNYPVVSLSDPMPEPLDKVSALPTVLFIDSTGVLRHVAEGYHNQQTLSEILKQIE